MTDKKEAPAGKGGGIQLLEKPRDSTAKDSQNSAKPQALREPFMTKPEPWPEPVDGAELLDAMVTMFQRYLSLPDGAAQALPLWVLMAHYLDAFEVSPRLAVLSPVPECGKTTVLKLLARLVPIPLPTSNITSAVVYRVIEEHRPTLLIDEADTFFDPKSEMAGILNSGHTRDTAYVWRCASAEKEFDPRSFSTWTAMAIAQIGTLPPTLDSRSITISMRRARPDEQLERLKRQHFSEIEILARQAVTWTGLNRQQLQNAEPQVPEGLNNRSADNWRPLLAIADLAGGQWPDKARKAALVLSGNVEPPQGVELLKDIRGVFDNLGPRHISSGDLCRELVELSDRPWGEFRRGFPLSQNQLAQLLKPFGIRPHVVRIGEKTPRGYEHADFEDAFARYL